MHNISTRTNIHVEGDNYEIDFEQFIEELYSLNLIYFLKYPMSLTYTVCSLGPVKSIEALFNKTVMLSLNRVVLVTFLFVDASRMATLLGKS